MSIFLETLASLSSSFSICRCPLIIGMMTDFGEYTPYESKKARFHSGVPAEEFHNQYPQEWAKLADEIVHELGIENDVVMFHRSAYTKSPGEYQNMFWSVTA